MSQIFSTYRIFALENYLNETTPDKTLSFDSLDLMLCFHQQVLPKQTSPKGSFYLSVVSLINHQFALVIPPQSSYLSLAHHQFEPHETDLEDTSEVETHKTHYEDSKKMVVKQLCRSLLLLASKSDKDQWNMMWAFEISKHNQRLSPEWLTRTHDIPLGTQVFSSSY